MEDTYTDSALSDKIKEFLNSYKEDGEFIYVNKIDEMMAINETALVIKYPSIPDEISEEFGKDPDRVIEAGARAVREVLQTRFPEYAKSIEDEVTIRITDFPLKKSVREINSKHTGRFITIRAMLIRMSSSESIPYVATYACPDGHEITINAKRNHSIGVPLVCTNTSCKNKEFEIIPQKSKFMDYQILQLQELPKELPAGMVPKTLGVFVSGSLVDSARMGDTVEISGMVRPELSKEIKLGIPVQTYRHRLYANNIEQLSNEFDFGGNITEEDSEKITAMVKRVSEEQATVFLIQSFASHIEGHNLIREALILTMIGSDSLTLDDGNKVRGDINIFLVGDPGTAKSEMGKAAYRVAPRAFFASGRGSSGVGLTAATIKDNVTGAYMLEPGICVLADGGVAIIDEFDKMRPEDRSSLHEVMEQQTASIAKGGITATLNARTSIIAIANPVYGRYDIFKNLTENIPSIPIPLLTRFDMIFVVRDTPSKELDTKIARHIMAAHRDNMPSVSKMDAETFAKYLRIAKSKHPKILPEAEDKILAYYIKMRNTEDDEGGIIVTPRQLEGLIRLTIARAKMLLKDEADEQDAERAIYILDEMFKSAGVDVNTGKVDIGVLSGKPKSEMNKLNLFQDIMKGLCGEQGMVTEKEIIEEMVKTEKWDENAAKEFFKKIHRDGIIYESSIGKFRPVT